ncbi:hypothetical protein ACHWQZ_G017983 [Mnemiopsis leidyi]
MASWRQSANTCHLWPSYTSGLIAGMVNVASTFPINKVIFRQQINGLRFYDAVKQVHKEGLLMLYRGMALPLCQKSVQVGLMYGLFETFYKGLPTGIIADHTCRTIVAATLTGISEAFVATPFERGQSLLQTPAFHGKIKNTLDLRHHLTSVRQWYRGLGAILLRNCSTNCLFFLFRTPLRNALPSPQSRKGQFAVDFTCGACLGGANSTLIYPVNVVKSYQQKQISSSRESFFSSCKTVLKERNYKVRKLYYGVQLNFTRALISWGIINATYETCMTVFNSQTIRKHLY